jgi:hypothetical protein
MECSDNSSVSYRQQKALDYEEKYNNTFNWNENVKKISVVKHLSITVPVKTVQNQGDIK